jgi:tRNA:m4X modification enzyme
MLHKHVKICPQTKKRKRENEAPYFLENVNCGGHGSLVSSLARKPSSSLEETTCSAKWAQHLARRVLQVHQSVFRRFHDGDIDSANFASDDVSLLTLQDIHDVVPFNDLSQQEIEAGIVQSFQSHRIKSGGSRHIPQLASLIGHLREMKVLPILQKSNNNQPSTLTPRIDGSLKEQQNPLVILEMGAGRGMFGLAAAGVASACGEKTHLIMVERTGSRSKADKALRRIPENADTSYLRLDNVQWSRQECDISNVNLPVLLRDKEFANAKVVLIAKHLCGCGTDLALKSLASIQDRVSSCIFATCCHGICDWQHYVGRDYLRKIMEKPDDVSENTDNNTTTKLVFGPSEFNLLRRWCAASVATTAKTTPDNIQGSKVSSEEERQEEADIDHICFATGDTDIDDASSATSVSSVVRELNLSCGVQGLGRACQRLIDFGRYQYLRHEIFPDHDGGAIVKLSHYVPPNNTPQNAALWAYTV